MFYLKRPQKIENSSLLLAYFKKVSVSVFAHKFFITAGRHM